VKAGLKVAVSGVGGDELFGAMRASSGFADHSQSRAPHRAPGLGLAARGLEWLPRTRIGSKLTKALVFGGDVAALTTSSAACSLRTRRAALARRCIRGGRVRAPAPSCTGAWMSTDWREDERVGALEIRQYLQVQLLRDIDAVSMAHSLRKVRIPCPIATSCAR